MNYISFSGDEARSKQKYSGLSRLPSKKPGFSEEPAKSNRTAGIKLKNKSLNNSLHWLQGLNVGADSMAIKKGDKVKVDYIGTFDDGKVFDSSEGRQPLEFEVGAGQMIKGFDDAVVGMKKGDEKDIKLKPAEAYGEHNPELIRELPKERLPEGPKPEAGMMIGLQTPDGKQFPAMITKVTDKSIFIDLNHPMAGKNLNFKIKIVSVA